MPQHPRGIFPPVQPDPLILEGITPELSLPLNDNSGESESANVSGDNFGEIPHKSLTPNRKDFHKNCGKPCE